MTIVRELNEHASELQLLLDLSDFMSDFECLSNLRHQLMARLRRSGLTVWAALHHLLKQSFARLRSYRQLRDVDLSSPVPLATGSLRTHPLTSRNHRDGGGVFSSGGLSSANNSLHRQQAAQRQQRALIADLRAYYHSALIQFNKWLALQSYIIAYYCALSFGKINNSEDYSKQADDQLVNKSVENQKLDAFSKISTSNTFIQPSKVLKFTIRQCEVGVLYIFF